MCRRDRMFIRVSGPGAFTGLLTMSVCSIGMVSKMYIVAIEDLDIRILESLDACGCNTMQKIRYGILPQLIPNFASTVIYRFDINLRDATVLGLSIIHILGRVKYETVSDEQAMEAFFKLSRYEGIIPAIESSHACLLYTSRCV